MTRARRRRRSGMGADLDLTAMVDVVFLLIIFFMVSTTFITIESGLPVDLPDAQMSVAQPSDMPTVTVTKDGAVYFGGVRVEEAQLAVLVRDEINRTGMTTVVLRADRDVHHGTAVRIMDLIKQGGAQRIAISTGG
ncbi:MAG: biopolymer transporter ExbD [Trueperaceae bacterium]|nr:biopolymer transporter ExbD [Truepera sp.]HRQ10584.1 biopolymer transporter ExbD [Trueperaceae bacterium]